MHQFPQTRDSLIIRIRDAADAKAWSQFLEVYRPMIYRVARKRGWQDADAQDLTQVVLLKVASKIDQFDPSGPARFRTWLTRVCHNAITDELRRRRPDAGQGGSTEVTRLSQHPEEIDTDEFCREQRRAIFRWAAREICSEFEEISWEAFRLTSIDELSCQEAAAKLGVSIGAVYTARSRVMRRLKQKVREHEDL